MEKILPPQSVRQARDRFSPFKFAALAASNAASVAAVFWNQSVLNAVTLNFPESYLVLLIPSMTFAGYASGVAVVAFSPFPRLRLSVERHLSVLALALLAASLAPSAAILAVASFAVGCGAAAAPRLLAAAAHFVKPAKAGAAIGQIVCCSLVAILCVRLFGGIFAAAIGWRHVFMIAAAIIVILTLLTWITGGVCVNHANSVTSASSITRIWRSHSTLRRAGIQQGALVAVYNASWMSVLVELPSNERPIVVIGGSCLGILAALLAGWLSDKPCQDRVATAGALAVFVAAVCVLPAAYECAPSDLKVMLLLIAMALVDAGLQIALVTNQKRVQALEPVERTRLAASLTVCGFLGGAVGAGAGPILWQAFGWQAALAFMALAGGIGLSSSILPPDFFKPSSRYRKDLDDHSLRTVQRDRLRRLPRAPNLQTEATTGETIREGTERKYLGSRYARQPSSSTMRVT